MAEASKAFFFEKKKQKTFASLAFSARVSVLGINNRCKCGGTKVFWSFFLKKDCLLSARATFNGV